METNIILQGDSLKQLKTLPEKSINMCMTSPPYWALRDYGVKGQLGLEPTFNEYINKLCDIFDEVKRVLKDDGTLWVNIGDIYASGGGKATEQSFCRNNGKTQDHPDNPAKSKLRSSMAKCLLSIPARFQLEMINRGWILRNVIIWHKNSCMPQSVKDRFTVDFEYIFFFSKKKKYYFKQQLEPTKTKDKLVRDRDTTRLNNTPGRSRMAGLKTNNYDFKNKRTTWTINPRPFKEAHFAVYPEELCETPIDAGCPEGGIVLDPFFGAGTTGVVALKQNKRFIGIELNPEYIEIAKKRLEPFLQQLKLF